MAREVRRERSMPVLVLVESPVVAGAWTTRRFVNLELAEQHAARIRAAGRARILIHDEREGPVRWSRDPAL